MTHDGKMVGTVTNTAGSVAHIDPDTSLSSSMRRRLGWSEGAEPYELNKSAVDKISGDEIHLHEDF